MARRIVLLALFVIAGVCIVWFRLDRQRVVPDPFAFGAVHTSSGATAASDSDSGTLQEPVAASPSELASVEAAQRAPAEEVTWIRGHLRIPDDTPKHTMRISVRLHSSLQIAATVDVDDSGDFRFPMPAGMHTGPFPIPRIEQGTDLAPAIREEQFEPTFQLESDWLVFDSEAQSCDRWIEDPTLTVEFATHLRGRVSGHFVLPANMEASRKTLGWTPVVLMPRGYRASVLDETLRFDFKLVKPSDSLVLCARPEGFVPLAQPIARVEAGKTTEVEIELKPTPTLAGRVVDRAGQTIASASVELRAPIKTWRYTLSAADNSRRFRWSDDVLAEDASFAMDLDDSSLLRLGAKQPVHCVAGKFQFASIPCGDLTLEAQAEDYFPAEERALDLRAGEVREDLLVQLDSKPWLDLAVVDVQRQVIAGASVFAIDLEHGALMDLRDPLKPGATPTHSNEQHTDDEGRVRTATSGESERVCLMARSGSAVGFFPGSLRLARNQRITATILVQPGTILFARAKDAANLPTSVDFVVEDVDGVPRAGRGFPTPKLSDSSPSPSGTALGPLPPSNYTLTAIDRNDERVREEIRIDGTPMQELVVHFGPVQR